MRLTKLIRANIDQHKQKTSNCTTIARISHTTFNSFHIVNIVQLHIILKKLQANLLRLGSHTNFSSA